MLFVHGYVFQTSSSLFRLNSSKVRTILFFDRIDCSEGQTRAPACHLRESSFARKRQHDDGRAAHSRLVVFKGMSSQWQA
jgi:hypothetical protein